MSNPNEYKPFNPPSWLTRHEKQAFNALQKLRKSRDLPLDGAEIPLLVDYVRALTRISTLEDLFADDDEKMRARRDSYVKDRLLSTARQIDATTKLAQRMRDRLLNIPASPGGGD